MKTSTITVTASFRASAASDTVTLYLTLSSKDKDYKKAALLASEKLSLVIVALKNAGKDEKDIKTSDFTVGTMDRYDQNGNTVFEGFEVTQSLTVTFPFEKKDFDSLVEALSKSGTLASYHVEFTSSNMEALCERALGGAVQKAKKRAEIIAREAKVTLGAIESIVYCEDELTEYPTARFSMMEESADFVGIDIDPKDSSVEKMVKISWNII